MSNKPPKHSERKAARSAASRMKEGWSRKRRPAPFVPINPERHLIVTEGTKTEPLYFEAIRLRVNNRYHGQWVTMEVVGTGKHTRGLLDRAVTLAEESATGFSHVWVVLDKDSFPAEDFNSVVQGCQDLDAGGAVFHAIWSNECFELWYILHFEYLQTPLSRDDYEGKLTGYLDNLGIGRYAKNRKDMFDILEPRLKEAQRNAKRLEKMNEGKTPAESCPGTAVHQMIEHLLPYFSDEGRQNASTM